MRVESITFNGIIFRRYPDSKRISDRNYFRPHSGHIRAGIQALHVEIWKSIHGPVPPKHHIHHIDENTGNNDPSNLGCMPGRVHLSIHGKNHPPNLEHLAEIRPLTKEWHASSTGSKWHHNHAIEQWKQKRNREKITFTCKECGNLFQAWGVAKTYYCSNSCKCRARRKSGVDDVSKVCPFCGISFVANKTDRTIYCSRRCSARMREANRVRSHD